METSGQILSLCVIPSPMAPSTPKKIAVLGGGISGLTTVAELTAEPDWQTKYDITVYQLGWRLGGKGASGRNRQQFDRIEEHGYHMWFGFYDNAFRLLRDIYTENARPLEMPLATWNQAFKPVNYWVTSEHVNGEWVNWPLEFRANPLTPGENLPRPTISELIGRSIRWMRDLLQTLHQTRSFNIDDDDETSAEAMRSNEPFWKVLCNRVRSDLKAIDLGIFDRLVYVALTRLRRWRRGSETPPRISRNLSPHWTATSTN